MNDSSGTVGLAGGVAGGTPITLTVNGLGSSSTLISHKTGVTNHFYGFAYYGALQGLAGASDVWGGSVVIGSPDSGISGGYSGAAGTLTVAGVISGAGPVQLGLNPGSTTVLAAANTYTGETEINCSTGLATAVQLGANNGVPAASGLNFNFNPAVVANTSTGTITGVETFDLNRYSTSAAYLINTNTYAQTNYGVTGPFTATVPAAVVNTNAGSVSTLTLTGNGTATYTFSGSITETATSGQLALVVNAPGGTQALAGASNYSGGTTVTAGTLVATAARVLSGTTLASSATGLGIVTVTGTGVLAGTGGTGAVVIANGGTITAGSGATAGSAPGTLTTGPQSWNASGGYVAKVASTTLADKLVMSGLTVPAVMATPFTVTALGTGVTLASGGQVLIATDANTSSPSATNPFAAALSAGSLKLGTASTVSPAAGDALALTTTADAGGFELYLTDVAAPEPTSLLLLGLTAAPLAIGRRRRRRV